MEHFIVQDDFYKSNKQPLRIQKDNTDLKIPIKTDSTQEIHTIPDVLQSNKENKKNKGSWINSLVRILISKI